MNHSIKIVLLFLISFLLAQPYTASAAKQKDLDELIKLVRQAATDSAKPNYHLSYMGMDYTIYITLKDGEPETVEVVAETFYGSKEDFKIYTLKDDNLDGEVDYGTYKQGGVLKATFDRRRGTGNDIKQNCQGLYDSGVRNALRRLQKKE